MARMKRNKIKKRFSNLLKPRLNGLFFPHGIYGEIVYYLEKDGYYGPHTIPEYVVPAYFSSGALSKLKENSEDHKIAIEAAHDGDLDKLMNGVDLAYGNQWKLPPSVFSDMVSSGCKPDVHYLDKDFNNGQYLELFDFLNDKTRSNHDLTSWEGLETADMKFWCYMFTKAGAISLRPAK